MYSQENPIVQLYKEPLYKKIQENSDIKRTEVNRSCGDSVTLYLSFDSTQANGSPEQFNNLAPIDVSNNLSNSWSKELIGSKKLNDWDSDSDSQGYHVISQVSFQGEGCSLSLSSAELMCRLVHGKTQAEAVFLARGFLHFLKSNPEEPLRDGMPQEFAYYNDLRSYPMRQKCAAMAWEILLSVMT